jgi:ankyrin repeat protein
MLKIPQFSPGIRHRRPVMRIRGLLVFVLALFLSVPSLLAAHEIHVAAANGDLEALKAMIEADRSLLESRDDAGSTPLHVACQQGNLEMARYLLGAGADPLAGDNENSMPIHVAAIGGNIDVMKLFLEKGIDVDIRDDNGMTPLLFAAYRPLNEMIDFLIAHGADIGARSNEGGSAVHGASYAGNVELLRRLIDGGADVDLGPDRYGNTPLAAASFRCQTEAARLEKTCTYHSRWPR